MINLTRPPAKPPDFFDLFQQVSDSLQAFENRPTIDLFQDAAAGSLTRPLDAPHPDGTTPLPVPQADTSFFNA